MMNFMKKRLSFKETTFINLRRGQRVSNLVVDKQCQLKDSTPILLSKELQKKREDS